MKNKKGFFVTVVFCSYTANPMFVTSKVKTPIHLKRLEMSSSCLAFQRICIRIVITKFEKSKNTENKV